MKRLILLAVAALVGCSDAAGGESSEPGNDVQVTVDGATPGDTGSEPSDTPGPGGEVTPPTDTSSGDTGGDVAIEPGGIG